ncbi:proline dehydrogenase family protein [bacterium]|nr:proline dehydrogenase family protein [bacterium]
MCNEHQLMQTIQSINNKNMRPIIAYVNEDKSNIENNYYKLKDIIKTYPNNYIAIKLSSLNIAENYNKSLEYSNDLANEAIKNNSKILIDAENYTIQNKINDVTNRLLQEHNKESVNIYKTYQMYRIDMFDQLVKDLTGNRDYHIGCQLVRGAYYNQDYKYNILYSKLEDTHYNYNRTIEMFFNKSKSNDILMCSTHNEKSINYCLKLLENKENKVEFAHLMGMSDNQTVFKYIPFL